MTELKELLITFCCVVTSVGAVALFIWGGLRLLGLLVESAGSGRGVYGCGGCSGCGG